MPKKLIMANEDIPIGNLLQYLMDIYQKVIILNNGLMNENSLHEHRRACLKRLIDNYYGGVRKAFAEAVGIDANYISRILSDNNKSEHRNIGNKILTKIGEVHPNWLDNNVEETSNLILSKPLNISGEIQGGDSGYLSIQQFPEGYAEGCVMHPVRNPRCYALRVRGDSMHPRIKHREVIVVDPDHPAEDGDEVVVSLKDGRQMVKVLLNQRDGEITLGSINDGHGNISIKIEDICQMHYVAAIIPLGSICKKV